MKIFFLIIFNLSIFYSTGSHCQQHTAIAKESSQTSNPFEGMWLREMDSMVLYIVDYTADSFAFVMVSYLTGYFGFLGGSDGEFYKYAKFKDRSASFNDTGAYSDGRPLYYEGEEVCGLNFMLTGNETIKVVEDGTCGVYGGRSTYWKGVYRKFFNEWILQDILQANKQIH